MISKIYNKIKNLINNPDGVYIQEEKHIISKYIPNNPIILEAGTHNGQDTIQMAVLWKKSKIYGFEPVPNIYNQTLITLSKYKNIKIFPFGLSDKSGKSVLYLSEGMSDGSSSLMFPKEHLNIHTEVKFDKKIEIQTYTIDDWAKQQNISKIDLLWLDLQGMEPAVLKSSPNILKTVSAIYTEVSLIETYEGVILYPEFKNWIETQGFILAWEDIRHKDMGNVLFIRK